jgi:RNA polymerase sigma factor (sigma-70 family)
MTERDDITLLRDFAATESEAAFAALVRRHINLVYSTALRSVGSAHAAEEISQAVFIILARKAKSLGAKTILAGWLHQTTRLTAANFLRGEIRRQKREQEAYMQSILNEPGENVWPQIAPLLDDALGKLGERDRNALVLRFLENKSLAEVGTALGASEDAAKMRVHRALEKLRKLFGKRGVALSATLIAGAVSTSSVQAAPVGLAATISTVAITKGAAAGGSTLTLVKGALKIMAWTKMKITAITVVGVLLVGGTTTLSVKVFRERGANYNGKPVRYWVDQSLWGLNKANTPETYGALRHIGAPAAELLVQALTQTNSAPNDPSFRASYVRQNAFAALEQMGSSAKSQVPELIGLLKHNDKDVRIWATLVLAGIGPAAKDAVPALMDESQDANYAAYAKEALRQIRH